MVIEAVSCKHRGQTQHVKRYGTTRASTQLYRSYDCGRTFVQTYP
ncbi:IS1/IS1595 family N-terminal zinc-binding domain-containing protein [Spirosoma flavum]